jgi:leucyl-tRNA synthetase
MDLSKIERKWQKQWVKDKIFEPKKTGKKYFFTVPYPYTSGPYHIGHGRTYSIGDFIARFKRKQGYNVLWPMAYHISGTPILAISDRIRKGDKNYIELFTNYVRLREKDESKVKKIIESFKEPMNVAKHFASVIRQDFESIGVSVDWTRQFTTGDKEYNKFIEWQFKKLKQGKALTQGSYPINFCVNCDNAVGEDDIKDGDADKVSINEFTAIKFDLGSKQLVAGTLRPETIYGITNLWVNPESLYVETNNNLIISVEAFNKLKYQQTGLKKTRELAGTELIGKHVTTPLGTEVPILPGQFVDPDVATGIVYSVPAHAPFDYAALRDLQNDSKGITDYGLDSKEIKSIKPITIINIEGYSNEPAVEMINKLGVKNQRNKELIEQATKRVYKDEFYKGVLNEKCAEFKGLKINEIKDRVRNKLISQGDAFTFYETSRKAECRCTGKVIVAVLNDQWFLDYTSKEWKDKTRRLINDMTIIPDKYRKSFIDTVDWLEKRPCARKRGLGTKLPYDDKWVIESLSDSTIYMAFYTIINIIHREKIKPEQLTPELFDYVFLGKGEFKVKWAREMREDFTYWYPLDHRHTAPAHISNHLTFFLFHHTKIFPKKYWPKEISFNEMVIREGVKMSKSKGNVIPLAEVAEKYSADLLRMFLLSSSDIDSVVDWRENEVASVKTKITNFANLVLTASKALPAKKLTSIDKWITSRFYSRIKEAYEQGCNIMIRPYAINIFFEFMNELNYYKKRVSAQQFNSVIRTFLADWLIALEPLIPHICEEAWSKINKGFVSLARFPKINESMINQSIEQNESIIMNTIKDINGLLSIIKTKPKKITLFIADQWKYDLYKSVVKSKNKHDLKELITNALKNASVKAHAKDATGIIQSLIRNPSRVPLSAPDRNGEYQSLNEAIKFLEQEYNTEVDVVKADNPKAMPCKPGILIE